MSSPARIAVVGTGWWATTAHLPALAALPNTTIAALCDHRKETLDSAAARFAAKRTYTDFREMLNSEELDGVVIAVWHSAHYEAAKACLERGLHVLLEKPMTLSASHARELVLLASRMRREIIIGYPYHYSPRALRAREVITSGELGDVRYINGYFASSAIDFYRGDDAPYGKLFPYALIGPGDVYQDPARSGGGQGHLQVTHLAALVHFITSLTPTHVMAWMNNLDVNVDVIDAIVVRMNNGALASIGSTGNLHVSDPGKLSVQINCDRGWIDLDLVTGTGRIRHADGTDEMFPAVRPDIVSKCDQPADLYPIYAPCNNLVGVINGTNVNGSPAEPAWRTVELVEAAYRSASQNGKSVSIESLYATERTT